MLTLTQINDVPVVIHPAQDSPYLKIKDITYTLPFFDKRDVINDGTNDDERFTLIGQRLLNHAYQSLGENYTPGEFHIIPNAAIGHLFSVLLIPLSSAV